MSTHRYQHVEHHPDVESFATWAQANDLPIIAIDNIAGSTPIEKAVLPQQCVLLFGQEGPGLSESALAASSAVHAITQYGSTRSLNAGVASGIAMFAWAVQHAQRT